MATSSDLISLFRKWILPTWSESEMQSGIETVLRDASLSFRRECPVQGGIIDFLVDRVGVECKIKSRPMEVAEQLCRYAENPEIDELLLVTSVASHRKLEGVTFSGKKVSVYFVGPFGRL